MKIKEKKELQKNSRSNLQKMLEEERQRLRVLRFDLAAGKVKNVREIQASRKKIALILTYLKLMTE